MKKNRRLPIATFRSQTKGICFLNQCRKVKANVDLLLEQAEQSHQKPSVGNHFGGYFCYNPSAVGLYIPGLSVRIRNVKVGETEIKRNHRDVGLCWEGISVHPAY